MQGMRNRQFFLDDRSNGEGNGKERKGKEKIRVAIIPLFSFLGLHWILPTTLPYLRYLYLPYIREAP